LGRFGAQHFGVVAGEAYLEIYKKNTYTQKIREREREREREKKTQRRSGFKLCFFMSKLRDKKDRFSKRNPPNHSKKKYKTK
jgi:hypothetical protein